MQYTKLEPKVICYRDKHALNNKKYIRANKTVNMTKQIKKASMHITKPRNKFLKNPSKENKINFKKQRNIIVSMIYYCIYDITTSASTQKYNIDYPQHYNK